MTLNTDGWELPFASGGTAVCTEDTPALTASIAFNGPRPLLQWPWNSQGMSPAASIMRGSSSRVRSGVSSPPTILEAQPPRRQRGGLAGLVEEVGVGVPRRHRVHDIDHRRHAEALKPLLLHARGREVVPVVARPGVGDPQVDDLADQQLADLRGHVTAHACG